MDVPYEVLKYIALILVLGFGIIIFPLITSHDWPYWKQQVQASLAKEYEKICIAG